MSERIDAKAAPLKDTPSLNGLITGMCVRHYWTQKDVTLTPRTGEVDFPALFKNLKTGGFTHDPLVVECLKAGNLKQTPHHAKKVRQFLENLITWKSKTLLCLYERTFIFSLYSPNSRRLKFFDFLTGQPDFFLITSVYY
jgi:hypothetical protein